MKTMKRSRQSENAFELLMRNRTEKRPCYVSVGIPKHLQGLLRKCPQWREIIMDMCGGQCRDTFVNMPYKEIESEITNRKNLLAIYESIKKKTQDFCESLQKRLQLAVDGKSVQKSEQERFSAASGEKARSLRATINSFFYGGQIYMEHLKASKTFDGLLELKLNSSKRGETVYLRQLQVIFDEGNSAATFLSTDHMTIIDFVNRRCDITRQFHLDLQAKGMRGMVTRKTARAKKDKSLKALGQAPSIYVPLANTLLSVQSPASKDGDIKEVQLHYESESDDNGSLRLENSEEDVPEVIISSDDEPEDNDHTINAEESDRESDSLDEPWGENCESEGDQEKTTSHMDADELPTKVIISSDDEPEDNDHTINAEESDIESNSLDEPWGENRESESDQDKTSHLDADELLNEIQKEI